MHLCRKLLQMLGLLVRRLLAHAILAIAEEVSVGDAPAAADREAMNVEANSHRN